MADSWLKRYGLGTNCFIGTDRYSWFLWCKGPDFLRRFFLGSSVKGLGSIVVLNFMYFLLFLGEFFTLYISTSSPLSIYDIFISILKNVNSGLGKSSMMVS